MKKDPKKEFSKKEYTEDDIKRYVGVVLEQVKDGFKVSQEHTISVQQGLKEVRDKMEDLEFDVKEIKTKVSNIDYQINLKVDRKVDKSLFVDLDRRINKLEKK